VAQLSISTDDTPQGMVIAIAGGVQVTEVDELERALQALGQRGAPQYVLDLSGLTFAASLAIGCLLRFRNQVTAAGGRVVLAEVQPLIHDAFRRAQLHRVFTIYNSVQEALNDNVVT
jgi:anti-sigma B factor antagonist